MSRDGISLLLSVIACLLVWPAASTAGQTQGQADHSSHRDEHEAASREQHRPAAPFVTLRPIPDVEVLDQHGRRARFYTDLVKGKVVAVGLFYTSCVNVCIDQGRVFSALQAKLGERLGRDAHLILITMDPWVDTPTRLKEWGEKFKVRRGWTLVTGEPRALESLAFAFGPQVLGQQEMHSSVVYVGNEPLKLWTVNSGLGTAESLLNSIESVARARQ